MISRRALLAGSVAALSSCTRRTRLAQTPVAPQLARVNVSLDRVIRTTVGLRPYRPSGFVVRTETVGAKTIVHNYGHGGAGITLSWGTAKLAVDQAAQTGLQDCAVIGCGVVGLSTARLLQEQGLRPVIYAKDMPPGTTSNMAGGLWEPVLLYDGQNVTPDFRKQFADAARFAFRRYQSLAGDEYAVRWLPLYQLSRTHPFPPPASDDPASDIETLYPQMSTLDRSNPFGVPYAKRRYTMLIEPATYLNALVRDFFIAGGTIQIRNFASASELTGLKENLIFNCTGLGARTLFNDQELTPIKGQLAFLLPQPEVNYCTIGPTNIYMFPRRDGILLGGSHERGNWSLDPDPATTERIVRENAALFGNLRS